VFVEMQVSVCMVNSKHLTVTYCGVTVDGVLDWVLDLLTTLTHNSYSCLITAPSLISTRYKSFPVRRVFISSCLITASIND
jgi:hypothetical protein